MQLNSSYTCRRYEWLKDGRPLGNPSNVYRIAEGTIEIRPLTSIDEGRYQCVAWNMFGKALSRVTVLQRAVLDANSPNTPIFESPRIQVWALSSYARCWFVSYARCCYRVAKDLVF